MDTCVEIFDNFLNICGLFKTEKELVWYQYDLAFNLIDEIQLSL